MRVFFAFDLDGPTLTTIVHSMGSLGVRNVKWCPREKLHVTARFVGDVDEAAIPSLARLLSDIDPHPISVRITRIDGFPHPNRANVVVALLDPTPAVTRIVDRLESGLVSLGHSPEPRAFRPHLTLARAKRPVDVRSAAAIDLTGTLVSLTLYASKNGYHPLERIALGVEQ